MSDFYSLHAFSACEQRSEPAKLTDNVLRQENRDIPVLVQRLTAEVWKARTMVRWVPAAGGRSAESWAAGVQRTEARRTTPRSQPDREDNFRGFSLGHWVKWFGSYLSLVFLINDCPPASGLTYNSPVDRHVTVYQSQSSKQEQLLLCCLILRFFQRIF